MEKYNPKYIESKWQKYWEEEGLYKTSDSSKKPKFYVLDMFPYPSGAGLHVGHPKGYIATDVTARYKILKGHNVLHPMGWDAFGLPAENYAIKNKIHPKIAVSKNIAVFKKQLEKFGFTYDWSREINTTDPEYYKWTQWIFLKMFEKGLAYESEEPVNWCPKCKTVLANEDLEGGKCERCGSKIIQKKLRQWVLKMTNYADRLLYDLDDKDLDWEDMILDQQRNWIGRSEGAEIEFKIAPSPGAPRHPLPRAGEGEYIKVYTTRVDTIFGCTYCVVAPENPIIEKLKNKIANYKEVEKYIIQAQNKTELERTQLQKEKTGVELRGIKIINPFNNEELPLFVGDYVLGFYGTGAVMAVPAHDERDFEFAKKYSLPIKKVIEPCFITTSGPDKVRSEPFVERDAITAIVKHWEKDDFIVLKWKQVDWKTFITGGPENGQTMEEGARTEINEETGYKNLKLIKELPRYHSQFYHVPKKINRFVHMRVFYFELKNGDRQDISEIDKKRHEVIWVSKENVEKFLTAEGHKFIWRILQGEDAAFIENGILANSEKYSGLTSKKARQEMTKWLEKNKLGEKKVNYKMRDWVFSRQRYWGEPIPIIHCKKCGAVAVPEKDLPVKLPEVKNYEPTDTGESPLANVKNWVNTKCPKCGGPAKRETNTMPQWAGSCWYYLRYIDSKNKKTLVDKKAEKFWMPVDLYVGGAEHATRHLLYSRFWHKFLYDIKAVSTKEPFKKLVHVGLINAEDGRKMSKRWGNVINPDEIIKKFGADAMRIYEMFMGPFSQNIAWDTKGVVGVYRFLEKVWKIANLVRMKSELDTNKKIESLIHKTIKKVSEDIENFRFNTAISQLMIMANVLEKEKEISLTHYNLYLILLSPFAPHIAEELWNKLGHKESIFKESWPKYDPKLIKDEEIELVLQVNGKIRDKIKVSAYISEEEAKKLAQENEKVKKYTAGEEIKKVIYVKGRLINIVM